MPQSCLVIGSGPSGVATAYALLRAGARVTLIDPGIGLQPERAREISQLSRLHPSQWSERMRKLLRSRGPAAARAKKDSIPQKLVFGSDYPYAECDRFIPADYGDTALRPTLARGGFSSIWGAAMMPYSLHDTAHWPVTATDLGEHYRAVAALTGLSAREDGLASVFPLYVDQPRALEPSRQARELLSRMEANEDELRRAGMLFGQARVGVRVARPGLADGCVYCRECMHGCAYGHIYNSEQTLREMARFPNFTYRSGLVAQRIAENCTTISVEAVNRDGSGAETLQFERVYLATGVIPTAQLLLRSMQRYEQPLHIKDSQYFLLPMLLKRDAGDVSTEQMNTLCQIYLEIFDPSVTRRSVHLQIYSHNDIGSQAIRESLGPLARPMEFVARRLDRRMLYVQGYLHSDYSANIAVSLTRGQPEKLRLRAESNSETRAMIKRVARKLVRHSNHLGALAVPQLLRVAEPGRGFHSGASIPMSRRPNARQSDLLGRPHGWSRLHVTDASVLPEIPATQITFSVMANAHRIGSASANLA